MDDRLLLIAERTEKLETPTRVSEEEVLLPFKGSSVKIVGKVSDEDMKKLADLLETFDVMEPFQRLERALEYLCSEK